MTSGMRRGRPRPALPVHMVVSRELTAAMRQIRIANGDHTRHTVQILNETITDLYPQAFAPPAGRSSRSTPHLVTDRYILRVERGHNAQLPVPDWLSVTRQQQSAIVSGSRVPPWLVRAYDVAFGADGYLVDMFAWATALIADHERNPPRIKRHLPAHVPPGEEYVFISAGMDTTDQRVDTLLRQQAGALAARRDRGAGSLPWRPSPNDGSGSLGDNDDELPEGTLVTPGAQVIARWVLRNTGQIYWQDRYLYRVNEPAVGIRTPPFVAVPDTAPSESVEIRVPLQAPQRPGTYRACLKMGWPDGTYCFPSTLLGVIVTLIVPPPDLSNAFENWPHQ